jgi:hypothetical protein
MTRPIAVIALLMACAFNGLCQEAKPPEANQKLKIGIWSLPQSFVSKADPSNKNGMRKPEPGFKSINDSSHVRYDASEYLKSQGATLPPGNEAIYDPDAGCLVVLTTQDNLDLLAALFEGCVEYSMILAVEISTLECLIPSENKAVSSSWPTYDDLQHLPDKNIKLLDRVAAVTKTGQRVSIQHISNPAPVKPSGGEQKNSAQASADSLIFQAGESGTKAEVEPVVGPDGVTIDVNISYRFRSQAVENAISELSSSTTFVTWDGYPIILQVSPVPNQEGKFLVVVGTVRLVNPGGWNTKEIRDRSTKSAKDKK